MSEPIIILLAAFAAILAGFGWSFFYFKDKKRLLQEQLRQSDEQTKLMLEKTIQEAEAAKKTALLEAKEEGHKLRSQIEREMNERRSEVSRQERRLAQKEEQFDRKLTTAEQKEQAVQVKEQELNKIKEELQQAQVAQRRELERIAQMSAEEAKDMLLKSLERELQVDSARLIKKMEDTAKEEGDRRAQFIIATTIQRWAADHTAETTVSAVHLPNDEMKGRIIGREGRNIRMLEALTGVDLIIDDTPECVIVSGFDPIRRAVAKLALEKLIVDGRIHPARIEEMVEKAQRELEVRIREAGEAAALEAGVAGLHPEMIKTIGRLMFRTSYTQNVLKHSIEASFIAAAIAAELGANVEIVKRAGLLHDIGKTIADPDEPHAVAGGKLAARYGEESAVVHAIAAHHYDEEPKTVEAIICAICDAISASRPGARRETLDLYVKRLEKLEKIASSFPGIEKSYAISAGREMRILVRPGEIDDANALILARNIAKKIEEELEYPGQIKITVIRETRAIEYAK